MGSLANDYGGVMEVAALPVQEPNGARLKLADLWEKATGGSDVAARPGAKSSAPWPKSPRPAGVLEAVHWFEGAIASRDTPALMFLVGGPGAGKSDTTSELVAKFDEFNIRNDGLAHRTYSFIANGKTLRLINDATISSEEFDLAPLVQQTTQAAEQEEHLIACVNRGVLVEELFQARSLDDESAAGNLVCQWLHSPGPITTVQSQWQLNDDQESLPESYIRTADLLKGGELKAVIVAVFLDVCSLLEERPNSQVLETVAKPKAGRFAVTPFSQRHRIAPTEIPAGFLLNAVVNSLGAAAAEMSQPDKFNPVVANLQSLREPRVQQGLLSLLRAAEIASSQRFTYREVWGAVVRSIVGDLPERISSSSLMPTLREILPNANQTPAKTFLALQSLAACRFSQAIFDQGADARIGELQNPVIRMTRKVDPLLDTIPGDSHASPVQGWSTPVTSALTGIGAFGSPLEGIKLQIHTEDAFHGALTDFDYALDEAYLAAIRDDESTDQSRRSMVGWYGRYLTRLYATANGIPAFVREIEAWTQAWHLSPVLPQRAHIDLENSLQTLLRPRRMPEDPNSQTHIPLFESRTDPLIGDSIHARVAVALGRIDLETSKRGDAISLELVDGANHVASIELDFSLVREALACTGRQSGITEVSDTAVPRLERLRAAQLVTNRERALKYRIVQGNTELPFAVDFRAQ